MNIKEIQFPDNAFLYIQQNNRVDIYSEKSGDVILSLNFKDEQWEELEERLYKEIIMKRSVGTDKDLLICEFESCSESYFKELCEILGEDVKNFTKEKDFIMSNKRFNKYFYFRK